MFFLSGRKAGPYLQTCRLPSDNAVCSKPNEAISIDA